MIIMRELLSTRKIPNWTNHQKHNCPYCLSTGPITLTKRVYEDFYRDFSYLEAKFVCPNCGFTVTSSGNSICGNDAVNELVSKMNTFFYSHIRAVGGEIK